ncbi:MAG: type II secretion system protein GspE [Planctomycetota bacterium]|nr:MAG: type II secretion system protein GspE [Planctomycetota bacterium]
MSRAGANGDAAGVPAGPTDADLARLAEALRPLPVDADHLRGFGELPGVEEDPWEALLSTVGAEEHAALEAVARRLGLRYLAEPRLEDSSDVFYERVPASMARARLIAGLAVEGGSLVVATSRPMQPDAFDQIERLAGMPVEVVLAPRAQVANLINRGYEQRQGLVEEIVEDIPLDERAFETAAGSIAKGADLLQLARQTPVIRLVNMILFEALRRRASDVHIQPLESALLIRYRVDGLLVDAFSPPLSLAAAISSRLKVMAELDIANRHSPQDGQTTVRIGARKIDIRLSCVPTIFGERLVLRLLDQSQTQLSLDALGMTPQMQDALVDLVERPSGIVLVTGPTGSGKTTTLYAALERIDRGSRNVMTIEDPVEYHLDSIAQVQVNPKRGVTFATGLRALLRQDPDVILVGEIRDTETAHLAVQASLTGHLVLATLHTNDAPSAVSRLQDIGVEPYLISSSLLAVLGQRLLRRVCAACGGTGRGDRGACETCAGSGYAGRVAAYELMLMSDELRRMAMRSADALELARQARDQGMRPMLDDARAKRDAGLTTTDELRRVLHEA